MDGCPEPGEFENEVVICVANDLWKGEVFVLRHNGDRTRLGTVSATGGVHSYTLGPERGQDVLMRFGVRFATGSPADPRKIYVYDTNLFLAEKGDVVFFHMIGAITYRNTTSSYITPLDKSQIFINYIPDRFTADSSESN